MVPLAVPEGDTKGLLGLLIVSRPMALLQLTQRHSALCIDSRLLIGMKFSDDEHLGNKTDFVEVTTLDALALSLEHCCYCSLA